MMNTHHIANDNEKIPRPHQGQRTRLSFVRATPRPVPDRQPAFGRVTPNPARNTTGTQTPRINNTVFNTAVLAVWIATIAALLFVHRDIGTPFAKIGVSILFGWASLLLLYVSKKNHRPVFKCFALLGTLLSLAFIGFNLYAGFNIHLPTGVALCLAAALTLALGAFTQEKFPIFVSGIFAALWVGMSFMSPEPSPLVWLFPTIFALQYWLSARIGGQLTFALSYLVGLAWIGGNMALLVQNAFLPMEQAFGITLLAAILYNRWGKRRQDKLKPKGLLHTNMAWCLGAIAALSLQYVWAASPGFVQSPSAHSMPLITITGSLVFAFSILAMSIMRTRSGHQSLVETVTLAILAVGLTLFIINPQILSQQISPFTPTPALAMAHILGGCIAAASIAMIFNGVRRGFAFMIMLGIVAFITELYLTIPALTALPESIYMFGYSALFSLLFLALFAQKSLDNIPLTGSGHAASP